MEERAPCGRVRVDLNGEKLNLVLFAATQWPDKLGAAEGRYRVQKGRQWIGNGRKYEFSSPRDLGQVVESFLNEGRIPNELTPARPTLRPGQRVRWIRAQHPAHENPGILTWIDTPPFQTNDGVWHVFLRGRAAGLVPNEPIPCAELQPL